MSEEQQQPPENPTPGALLKAERERAGISQDYIADKLRLKVKAVDDLESDRYDERISLTFIKGYLRNYAKALGMNEAPVVEAFERQTERSKEPAKLQSFSRRVAKQASDDRLMLLTYGIVFVVVALVVLWWWQESDNEPPVASVATSTFSESDSTDSNIPANTLDTDDTDASLTATVQYDQATVARQDGPIPEDGFSGQEDARLQAVEVSEETADEVTVSGTSNEQLEPQNTDIGELSGVSSSNESELSESAGTDVTSSTSTESDGPDTESTGTDAAPVDIVFEFSGDCWMNLVDATGEAIAFGVKKAGRVMPVSGIPPFEVTLGAPEVVQIRYDGVAIDMAPYAGRTARFTLPLGN